MNTKRFVTLSAALALALTLAAAGAARASQVTFPYTFQANSAASASQVNANFTAVKTAVDDNNGRINSLQTTVNGKRLVCTLRDGAQITLANAGHNDNASDTWCAAGEQPVWAVAWGGQCLVDQVYPISSGNQAGLRAWYFNLAGGAFTVTPQVMCCTVQ